MRSHLVFIGMVVAACSLFWSTRLLERAHVLLSAEQVTLLSSGNESRWSQFLVPLIPVVLAYVLLSVFPRHQALIAVPAVVFAAAMFVYQYRSAAKRTRALDLPAEYYVLLRKSHVVLIGGASTAVILVLWSRSF